MDDGPARVKPEFHAELEQRIREAEARKLADDVRILTASSEAAQNAHDGQPWWTANDLRSGVKLHSTDTEHIEACDPARITRVLDRLEALQRERDAALQESQCLREERNALLADRGDQARSGM